MFDFTVVPDEGDRFKLTAGMRDIVMWERTHKGRAFAQLGDDMSATMLYEIAYSACRRQQLVPREMSEQQFMATHEIELDQAPKADEPDAPEPPPVADLGAQPDPFDGFAVGRAPVHASDEPARISSDGYLPVSNAVGDRQYAAAELRHDHEDEPADPTRPGA